VDQKTSQTTTAESPTAEKPTRETATTEPLTGPTTTACARCGHLAEGLPLTWTCSVENGQRVYFCVACARKHLRSIESRLDSAWW
jgi:DNA-directed RNA polymerase subunit RPC12/RpoP